MRVSDPEPLPTKRRVLFVDDNPILARIYALVLEDPSQCWEGRSVTTGSQALELMALEPFDVVVADLHMPQMNGIELMVKIRSQYPRTSRFILSGIQDQAEIPRCLGDTHQFISKPV